MDRAQHRHDRVPYQKQGGIECSVVKRLIKGLTDMDVKGSTVDVKGSTVDVKGSTVDVKGSILDVKGSTLDVKGYIVDVKGSIVDVKGLTDRFRLGRISGVRERIGGRVEFSSGRVAQQGLMSVSTATSKARWLYSYLRLAMLVGYGGNIPSYGY
eukprot:1180473-Prorocentrum_minimum.AAC.1